MDWLTFWSNIISSFSWPLTIIIIVIILRKPIANLIQRIRRIQSKETSVDFDNAVGSLEQQVDRILITPNNVPYRGLIGNEEDYQRNIQNYYNFAIENSRAGIMNAWLLIEEAVRDLAKRKDLNIRYYPPTIEIIKKLLENNIISKPAYVTIDRARKLRNEAVHNIDFIISSEAAQEYITLANKISLYLRSL